MRHKSQTILLAGFLGAPNIGDEAIALSVIQKIKRDFNEVRIIIISGNPSVTEQMLNLSKEYQVVKSIYPGNGLSLNELSELISAMKNSTKLLFVGGGLIQDVHALNMLKHLTFILSLAAIYRVPSYAIGIGIGPIKTKVGIKLASYVLTSLDYISVRDFNSIAEAKKISINSETVYYHHSDTALAFEPIEKEKKRDVIGICLRTWFDLDVSFLEDLIIHIRKLGKTCVLMGYEKDDKKLYGKLSENGSYPDIKVIYPKTVVEARTLISCLSGLISMRLHANIFAYVEGVPFVALSYDPKIKNVFEEINMGRQVVPLKSKSQEILNTLFACRNITVAERLSRRELADRMISDAITDNKVIKNRATLKDSFYLMMVFFEKVILKGVKRHIKKGIKKIWETTTFS